MKNAGYAFPTTKPYDEAGMSMRDYFAANAMQGICAAIGLTQDAGKVAAWSYNLADAMLTERNK